MKVYAVKTEGSMTLMSYHYVAAQVIYATGQGSVCQGYLAVLFILFSDVAAKLLGRTLLNKLQPSHQLPAVFPAMRELIITSALIFCKELKVIAAVQCARRSTLEAKPMGP